MRSDFGGTAGVCVAVDCGASGAPSGAAHVLEHIVLAAGPRPIAEVVELSGGFVNAETRHETMLFYARTTPSLLAETQRRLLQAVENVDFDEDVFEQERSAALREVTDTTSTRAVAYRRFLRLVYGASPLGLSAGGTEKTLSALTRADFDEALQTFKDASVVIASSQFGAEDVEHIRTTSPRTGLLAEWSPADPDHQPRGETAWLVVGGIVPDGRTSHSRYAFDVLASLLSNSPASPLYSRLRRQASLSHRFGSAVSMHSATGSWRVEVLCRVKDIARANDTVKEALLEVAAGELQTGDVAAARARSEMKLRELLDSPLERAKLSAATHLGTLNPLDSAVRQIDNLRRVTTNDVARAAASVLATLTVVSR